MLTVPVLLASTRRQRRTPRVARFVHRQLAARDVGTTLLDLDAYDFPILEERLRFRDDPPDGLEDFSQHVGSADGVVIVTPEYNHGYPGVLKNAVDYLLPEFRRKAIGIVTVSAGAMGGNHCLVQLQLVFLGMGAVPVPASLQVTQVADSFGEDGEPADDAWERRAERFLDEMLWLTAALAAARARDA